MELRKEILKEHSKAQCSKIVNWVGQSQSRFDVLFQLFLTDEYRVVQRAAWPVSYCVEAYPHLIKNHFKTLISNLHKPGIHDAVKRNTVRMLQHVSIPKKYQGEIMDICFNYLASPTAALAIKVFSLSVLSNLSKDFPEIIPEIKLLIDDQINKQTAGFKSRVKRLFPET